MHAFLSSMEFLSKLTFSKNKSFRNTIKVSNCLDPDLGPNCLKDYQQTEKVATNEESVNVMLLFWWILCGYWSPRWGGKGQLLCLRFVV